MAKLNTRSAATDIAETDIFLKDNTGSTTSEKVEFPLLRSKVLKGKNWTIVADADYSLNGGDKVTIDTMVTANRVFDLPAAFNTTDDANEIMVWNASELAVYDIILTPSSGDTLVIDGASLSVDATYTLSKGKIALITPRVTDSEWNVHIFSAFSIDELTVSNITDLTQDHAVIAYSTGQNNRKIPIANLLTTTTWEIKDSAAYGIAAGDRVVAQSLGGSDRAFTLEGTFDLADNQQEVWVWNGDTSVYNIVLTPASGDILIVNGVSLGADTTYNLPSGVIALIIPNISNASWSVVTFGDTHRITSRKKAITLGVAATTFAVTSSFAVVTGDGGGNTIATITGGTEGQTLTLLFVDALVTITDDNAQTADSVDLSAAFTSADDTTLTLIYDGTSWYETSRSVN